MATQNILVAVRMRPLIPREIEKNEIHWKAEPPTTICQINTSEKPVAYSFDRVFDSKVDNEEIYSEICSDIVRSVIDGFNGTIFAYGQTSSGKTFTMLGDKEKNIHGIMHYAISDIFNLIQDMPEREFLLRVSYMEIYNETVRDLLTEFSFLAGLKKKKQGHWGTFKTVKINQSLLSLGQVIRQLSENENQFISYRDSKLTRILQNSLGGNSLTAIICTVTAACFDETQSTLKFAERAKHIRNKPQVNEVLTEQALLKQYANKIKKLTAELEATKEEKSQQNRHLQEKIKYLEKQFVFQMNPALKVKSNRRETWGGTLDAARFRLQMASQNSFGKRKSFSRSRVGSCNLSILEEQSEDADTDELFMPFQSTQQLKASKRSSNTKRNSDLKQSPELLKTADAAVQAESMALCFSPKLSQSERDKMKMMADRISYLEKELAELREFTTLERQIMGESCMSSNISKVKNTISASDEGLPCHSESFSTNVNTSLFEQIDHKNLINEDSIFSSNMHEDSIFSPSDTSKMKYNEESEDLFQYLESTMKIMGMRKHIDFPTFANDLNNNYKITLEMFNLILQYQCLTFKGCFKSEICKKIDEVLGSLKEVFKSFSDKTTSNETIENQIKNFMNKTDYLLKEIEMCSLDSADNDKNEILNQSRPFDSITDLPSFEESPRVSLSREEIHNKNNSENVNTLADEYKDENIEENIPNFICDCKKLKSKIVALEKDIEVYKNSISDANCDNTKLRDKIAALEKQIEIFQISASSAASESQGKGDNIIYLEKEVEANLSDNTELRDKIAALEKQIEVLQTSASDAYSENQGIKDKIICLEKDIEAHLKTISDYKYDSNLKDEQITILKDKIAIQKQIIDSFQSELTLKDNPECKCNLEITPNIAPNDNSNPLITFKDQSCQVAYMEGISLISSLNESNISEQDVNNLSRNLCSNCDTSLNDNKVPLNEQHSDKICLPTLPALHLTDSEKENSADQLKTSFEATLKDLTELKSFTLDFMKREVKKEYLADIGPFDELGDYPLTDQIKVEVTALKELLLRLELYLQVRSDAEKSLTDFVEGKLVEISVLEDKLAESESTVKNKEAELDKLGCALSNIEDNLSQSIQKLKSLESIEDKINYFELEDNTSFIAHSNKSFFCVASIQKMVSEMDMLINKTVVSVDSLSVKLKEAQDELIAIQSKENETKSVQTIEDYDYLGLSQKLKETEDSNEKLEYEIKNLKSELEILTEENDYLEQELKRKINFYDTEIEDMKIKFATEKEEWTSKRVKETEEKYYRMIMEQESKFLEEKHQAELDFWKQIGDYKQKLADQFDQLQEENRNNITDLKSKLNTEVEERCKERMKLEDKIRSREKDLTQYREYNSYLKRKCKELANELKKRKEKVKSFEQKENVLQEKSNENAVDCKQTQTDDYHHDENTNLCDQCKIFMQKISDLETIHQSAINKSEALVTKLQNDLEAKKAKIISLDTNNAKMVKEIVTLKKEISTKSTLLRFCQCRGVTSKMTDAQSSGKLESTEKNKPLNLNLETNKEKPSDSRNNLNSQDILQMEIVQDAIKKARAEEKELLLSAGGGNNGPALSMQCYYLQAKLNKQTSELDRKKEELNSLKTELAKLKKYHLKQDLDFQNEPFKGIKGVEENFTPCSKLDNPLMEGEALHPKMQRRKVLKETNRKHIAPFPTSKEDRKKENINNENINPFKIPISLESIKTSEPAAPDNEDKALDTQRQLEMLFGAPTWEWL
ncbi:Kinesin-like protein KIN-7K [Argiope bruennichi]|uniref:Kinesin-like protein KIN-7K n=1 Tax=Argiope bruennichi TaxID=94029 RepID=A0A8T0EVF4_ARGBR|nr:Kinesin-like protein KIN-7K [Argiope bruennichi]